MNSIKSIKKSIAIIGMGYVGLPLAAAFSVHANVIGFDVNREKIGKYKLGIDLTGEIGNDRLSIYDINYTSDEKDLIEVDIFIIAVPTPIKKDKSPDLRPLESASKIVGRNIKKDAIVVYESTVYPGVTENICVPLIEEESGLKCGVDFNVGYSPERINPADKVNRLKNIVKIVSANTEKLLDYIASLYELIIEAGVYKVKNIKIAEAAKLAENMQRDINIAFVNELALVFDKIDINTNEVIDAMNTKWNSLNFRPGLVGGHCIGVDPYYYIYMARKLGFDSKVVANSRNINDSMGEFIATKAVKLMVQSNINVLKSKIYILGATFKENCPDTRNSKVKDIIIGLKDYGVKPILVDTVANREILETEFETEVQEFEEVRNADCLIFAVAHDNFKNIDVTQLSDMYKKDSSNKKVLLDVKGIFNSKIIKYENYLYWSL